MLRIPEAIAAQIVEHAMNEHPIEACGVVAGPSESGIAERLVRLRNRAQSPTFYEVDSADLYELYREMASRGEDPIVIYHSHTSTAAYPSDTDVQLAAEPLAHYVIVSTPQLRGGDLADDVGRSFRSFRISNGRIAEESVELW
jgi:proteasome lid subunit RPN8/RPN11